MTSSSTSPTDLRSIAARLGGFAWICDQLFVLQGRWSSELDDDRAVTHLATHSRHHGWHSQVLSSALPDSSALDASALVTPPWGWDSAFELSDSGGTDGADAVKLGILYRGLVPRFAGLVHELAGELTGSGDVAIARVLGFVAADTSTDLLGGVFLLSNALTSERAITRVAEIVGALDEVMAS